MIKKELTYVDLNGNQQTDILYFNLNALEQVKMDAKYAIDGCKDMKEYLSRLREKPSLSKMIAFVEDLILSSYLEKSEDGKHYNKSSEVIERFSNSVAYAELFEQLVTDEEQMKIFAESILTKPIARNNTATVV